MGFHSSHQALEKQFAHTQTKQIKTDAAAEVLEKQIQSHDPLTESEVDYVVRSVN